MSTPPQIPIVSSFSRAQSRHFCRTGHPPQTRSAVSGLRPSKNDSGSVYLQLAPERSGCAEQAASSIQSQVSLPGLGAYVPSTNRRRGRSEEHTSELQSRENL